MHYTAVWAAGSETRIFNDTAGHWAEEILERWGQYGVISSVNGNFRPDDQLTIAEFGEILVNLMNYSRMAVYDPEHHTDLDPNEWYMDIMMKLLAAQVHGPVQNRLLPNTVLTREQCAAMLARAFRIPTTTSLDSGFNDNSDITISYRPLIRAMRMNGFLLDLPFIESTHFRPRRAISRAEAVAMFDGMVDYYINVSGGYTGELTGTLLIAAPNVTLHLLTSTGNIFLAESARGIVLDDITVSGEITKLCDGYVLIQNSRINRIVADARSGELTVETVGATSVQTFEMRRGGRILANQNIHNILRTVVISDVLPDGDTVVIEGRITGMINRKGANAVINTRNAELDTSPFLPYDVNVLTAERTVINKIDIELTPMILGTAHIMIINNRHRIPTNDEIRLGTVARDVFYTDSFRVYPGSTEAFSVYESLLELGFINQGHVVYVLLEDEQGRIAERLVTDPVNFMPVVTHLNVLSPFIAIANFDTVFTDGADVEESFEMFILRDGIRRPVEFRAFNMLRNTKFANESQTYRIVLLYGERLSQGDSLIMRPKNNTMERSASVDYGDMRLFELETDISLHNILFFSCFVTEPCDIFYVLTDEYIPGYYAHAQSIINGEFPTTTGVQQYGFLEDVSGNIKFQVYGFLNTDTYYLYIFTGFLEEGIFSEVELIILERRFGAFK
jgi:hypothetical protein